MKYETRRFSELRADGVESNLFQYHLRHVIKKGLVEKSDDGYQLAPAGLYYADRYSPAYKGERPQPKLITATVLRNSKGQVLLLRKQRQPWVGRLHLPAGKVHTGEVTDKAARREVQEKTGLCVTDVTFRAVAHIQIYKQGVIVSDLVAFVFAAQTGDASGVGEWHDVSDGKSADLAPSVRELLQIEQYGDGGFHAATIDVSTDQGKCS